MRRLEVVTIIVILSVPLFFVPLAMTKAPDPAPFAPHELRVLVVSPADIYYSGANYLVSDLARYGFNITHQTSNDPFATNYLNDSKTSNLSQYDVVIVHGILGFAASKVSVQEVTHFTRDFRGILILIGDALFQNETGNSWWDFDSDPVHSIDQRLGVNFTSFSGAGGAWHNSGTFTLTSNSIAGLPTSLSYESPFRYNGTANYQLDLTTNGAITVYDFTISSSPSPPLVGKTTRGVTFYRANDGAVGIYIQGAYIYGSGAGTQINYFGLTDTQSRSLLLASLIASAVNRDINTVIKPQPLANIRLDGVGQYLLPTYLNASLANFNSFLGAYNITPTIGFIDYLPFTPIDYWKTVAPDVLTQLNGKYRDWEYSTNLRYYAYPDTRTMTQAQIAGLIDNIKGNYSRMGMNLFSTVIAPQGRWNQSTLDAMTARDLYLLDILDIYDPDWWNLRVNSTVIVHGGASMLPETGENFTQPNLDLDSINYRYFFRRNQWALAVVNGFPSFVYYPPNFRWNEVGTNSLRTVYENLTYEIPDVRFVPLMEAGMYFGNKWMHVENASRTGSTIEFDIDASAIPSVVSIDKGMLWLRINANESIQSVTIDNNPWFYFDSHSIRMPTPTSSSHVKIILGESPSPRVDGSRYKVVEASYDGYRLNVSISSVQDLNVSVRLFLPKVGPFRNASWNVVSMEAQWSYNFDAESHILKFWAISDGFVTFEVGVFMSIQQTPPWYNSSVTLTLNFTGLQTDVQEVTLSYHINDGWFNITMTLKDGLWVAPIPAMRYGTVVEYKVFVSDVLGHLLVSGVFSYQVIDVTPPEVGVPVWGPSNPAADEPVSVNVSVTKPENASGIRDVVLWYYLGTDIVAAARAKSVNMTHNGNAWSVEIPGQSGGTQVSFFIVAHDKAGNLQLTPQYSYSVANSLISPFQAVLLGIGLMSAVGVTLYFVRFRKKRVTKVPAQKKLSTG